MPRTIRAPRGVQLTCENWLIEAAYRMLQRRPRPGLSRRRPMQPGAGWSRTNESTSEARYSVCASMRPLRTASTSAAWSCSF
jgi:hypothetical protein